MKKYELQKKINEVQGKVNVEFNDQNDKGSFKTKEGFRDNELIEEFVKNRLIEFTNTMDFSIEEGLIALRDFQENSFDEKIKPFADKETLDNFKKALNELIGDIVYYKVLNESNLF